jgi:alpha-ketoglutarate-dependent taurine dioxygenase
LLGASEPGVSVIKDTPESPPDADGWHTDVSWLPEPPQVAVLRAEVIPDAGGDIDGASLSSVYERLAPAMQEVCAGLTVHHDQGPDFHWRSSAPASTTPTHSAGGAGGRMTSRFGTSGSRTTARSATTSPSTGG